MPSILIVDDSPIARRGLRTFLEGYAEWQVCGEAGNGQEGIDKALELSPQLILMDLSMPVMNGLQAARELRRVLPQIPVLMLTTFCDPQIEKEGLASGARAVKSKSAGLNCLYDSIQELLPLG